MTTPDGDPRPANARIRPVPRLTGPEDVPDAPGARDTELVRRFVAGDEDAFTEIMRRHQAKIFAVALNRIRNHADAEEITQDTFVRAYRNLPHFRGDASLATWLHCIAVNLSRNRYWYFFRRRRHTTFSLDCMVGENGGATLANRFASPAPDPAHESVREEFTRLVTDCMDKLDARHREILTLRNLQNHSYDEIAQQLAINLGTVKSRIARARERLRVRLAEACPEFTLTADPSEWFESWRTRDKLAPNWS